MVELQVKCIECNRNFYLFISNENLGIDIRINQCKTHYSIDDLNFPLDENEPYYFKQIKSLKEYLKSNGIKRVKFIKN